MRRDRGRPAGSGSPLLRAILLLAGWILPAGAAAQERAPSPEALVERAAREARPGERAALARAALKTLARRGEESPLLEARAWLLLGDFPEALRALERFPLPPGGSLPRQARPLFRQALEGLVKEGKASQALPLLLRLYRKLRPRPRWLPSLLVRAWPARQGKEEVPPELVVQAGREALEAGERDPAFLRAYFQILVGLDLSGRPEAALPGFRALARAFPREKWTALSLAVVLRHLGRYRQAAEVLHRAAKLHPHDPALPTDEGLCWKCLGRMDRAEACFRRAMAAAPPRKTRDPRISLGLLLLDRGRRREAQEVLRPTLDLDPPQPYAWLLWVRSAFCRGKRGF